MHIGSRRLCAMLLCPVVAANRKTFCMKDSKETLYASLLAQVASLCEGEKDLTAKMANVSALLHSELRHWWTGFYRVVDGELLLGPFQGPLACVHIGYGRGVCGSAWQQERTLVVPDVDRFPGHIACSSASKSEVVVPMFLDGKVIAVLDIDSQHLAAFDRRDALWLERIVAAMV